MQPCELDCGPWRLRPLSDAHGDAAALALAFADPDVRRWALPSADPAPAAVAAYLTLREQEWQEDRRCSWAVCPAGSPERMLAEIGLKELDRVHGTGEIAGLVLPGARQRGLFRAVFPTVLGFGFDRLGLHRICGRYAEGNRGSQRLVTGAGFRFEGREREAVLVDGERRDLLRWARLATDPPVDLG